MTKIIRQTRICFSLIALSRGFKLKLSIEKVETIFSIIIQHAQRENCARQTWIFALHIRERRYQKIHPRIQRCQTRARSQRTTRVEALMKQVRSYSGELVKQRIGATRVDTIRLYGRLPADVCNGTDHVTDSKFDICARVLQMSRVLESKHSALHLINVSSPHVKEMSQ